MGIMGPDPEDLYDRLHEVGRIQTSPDAPDIVIGPQSSELGSDAHGETEKVRPEHSGGDGAVRPEVGPTSGGDDAIQGTHNSEEGSREESAPS